MLRYSNLTAPSASTIGRPTNLDHDRVQYLLKLLRSGPPGSHGAARRLWCAAVQLMVKVAAFDAAVAGLVMVTDAVPAAARSEAGMATLR